MAKFGTKTKRIVVYRAPCGVRLRNEAEVWKFLIDVKSGLTIDMFTFDSSRPYVFAKSVNPLEAGSDYSNNKELYIRIPWVNCCSRYERPPIIDYVSKRFASNQVRLNADMDFVSCCSCQDNCSDKNKCECQKLTIKYASMVGPNYHRNKNAGYEHRRLLTPLVSGIFECNEGE